MNWFLIAVGAPVLWSIVNHLDKYLLEKYFKGDGVGVLMIFSSLIGILTLPVFFILDHNIFAVPSLDILTLLASGVLGAVALLLYFLSLDHDEASVVVPFYQLIPVFAYILGYFFLGEVLHVWQIIAMVLIVGGALIISFEIDEENHFKVRRKTVLYMTISSLTFALAAVMFKFVAIEQSFWGSLFWDYAGLSLTGIALFIFWKTGRGQFLKMFKENKASILSLNFTNEALTIVGNLLESFAMMLAPVALVLLVNSYQPIFVFAIGILITLFIPKLSAEKIELKHLIQKIIAFVIMGVGTYLLFLK